MKVLFVLLAALLSLVAAICAGLLSRAAGNSLPGAILYAGGAFAISMTLCMVVLSALKLLS